jgi:hypothetical protein
LLQPVAQLRDQAVREQVRERLAWAPPVGPVLRVLRVLPAPWVLPALRA